MSAAPPSNVQDAAVSSRRAWTVVLPLLVVGAGLVGTWAGWNITHARHEKAVQTYFDFRVRDAVERLEHRVVAYEQVLESTHAHFQTSDVTRDGFRRFVAGMRVQEVYPGIQGVGFTKVIAPADLEAHVAQVRAEGFPAYAVRPAGERDPYTSIVMLEPFAGRNLRAFGFDMHSEPVRREAMERACETGDTAASGKVTLVQETERDVQSGFLMYRPLFGPGGRRPGRCVESLVGWVYAPFRMRDFMRGVLGEQEKDLNVMVFDGEGTAPASLLFADDDKSPVGGDHGTLVATRALAVAQHPWTVVVAARPDFEARLGRDRSPTVAVSTLLATLTLLVLTIAVQRDRNRALALAEDRDGRYQQILQQAHDAILLVTGDGRITEANPRACEHFGHPMKELLALNILEVHAPEVRSAVGPLMAQVRKEHGSMFETVHLRGDGTRIPAEVSVKVIRVGNELRALAVVRDVSERRQALASLREREEQLGAIFLNSPVGIARSDVDGHLLDSNPAFQHMLGYTAEELHGLRFSLFTHPDDEAEHQRLHDNVVRGEAELIQTEARWVRKDGTTLWVSLRVVPVQDKQGKPRFLFGMVEDITQRRLVQQALEKERRRYRSIMAISQDGIHLLDEDGGLVDANAAFLNMLGQGPDAIGRLNVRDWDAKIRGDQIADSLRTLMETPGTFQTLHRRSDGTVFDVEVSAGSVELEGRRYLLASSRDVSARRLFEEQLRHKQAELEELNHALEDRIAAAVEELRNKDSLLVAQGRRAAMGEMIGNIAHQWRQPLNALALVLADLKDAWRFKELDDAGMERAVAEGNRQVQKMSSTINDFRDFFRPDKEKLVFAARGQVEAAVGLMAASFDHAGISVTVEGSADVQVLGYPNEYSQVLLNILSNAKQAIQDRGVEHGSVAVTVQAHDGMACVVFRDNGGGLPAAVMERLFEPYFSTKKTGTGIGLYLSRQILGHMDGRLEARNVEGGAEFTVVTPLARAP